MFKWAEYRPKRTGCECVTVKYYQNKKTVGFSVFIELNPMQSAHNEEAHKIAFVHNNRIQLSFVTAHQRNDFFFHSKKQEKTTEY